MDEHRKMQTCQKHENNGIEHKHTKSQIEKNMQNWRNDENNKNQKNTNIATHNNLNFTKKVKIGKNRKPRNDNPWKNTKNMKTQKKVEIAKNTKLKNMGNWQGCETTKHPMTSHENGKNATTRHQLGTN